MVSWAHVKSEMHKDSKFSNHVSNCFMTLELGQEVWTRYKLRSHWLRDRVMHRNWSRFLRQGELDGAGQGAMFYFLKSHPKITPCDQALQSN